MVPKRKQHKLVELLYKVIWYNVQMLWFSNFPPSYVPKTKESICPLKHIHSSLSALATAKKLPKYPLTREWKNCFTIKLIFHTTEIRKRFRKLLLQWLQTTHMEKSMGVNRSHKYFYDTQLYLPWEVTYNTTNIKLRNLVIFIVVHPIKP